MKQASKSPKSSRQVATMMRTGKVIDAAVKRAVRKATRTAKR